MVNLLESSRVKYDITKDFTGKDVKVISKSNSKKLKDIYGGMLSEVMRFYIREANAQKLMFMALDTTQDHNEFHISEARAATVTFLIIGRFRQSDLLGEKFGVLRLPYDVVKLIAKMVWNTRFATEAWGITGHKRNKIY